MSSFGRAHLKEEGAPAHPDDVYVHCGCIKCEAKFMKQAEAYYLHQAKHGRITAEDRLDPRFPETLK